MEEDMTPPKSVEDAAVIFANQFRDRWMGEGRQNVEWSDYYFSFLAGVAFRDEQMKAIDECLRLALPYCDLPVFNLIKTKLKAAGL